MLVKCVLILAAGNKPGPDRATTTVGEDVSLSLRAGGKVSVSSGDEETREFTDGCFSPQQKKNHHKKKRFASNSPSPPVEERSSVVSARVATLPQNAHTRTVFPSSTKVVLVCRISSIETGLLNLCVGRNAPVPGRSSPERRPIDLEYRWEVRSTEYARWTRCR